MMWYGWIFSFVAGLVALLPALISRIPHAAAKPTRLTGSSFGRPAANLSFDYVVVGGGTAGNTVALRLAESGASVALVEAGTFYEYSTGNLSQVPHYATLYGQSDGLASPGTWNLNTVPQKGYNDRVISYVQGKVFGGGSAVNLMGYQRQTKGSAKLWADRVGDNSFEWDDILPYYQRSCHFTPPNVQKTGTTFDLEYDPAAYSADGGPLKVSAANYPQPFNPALSAGLTQLGLSQLPAFSSGQLLGYSSVHFTIDNTDTTRSSSATSFLAKAIESTPLQVFQLTYARQILFEGKRAVGVTVESIEAEGSLFNLTATKEVIVSAGAFRSPQLLMVSGIGPASKLESLQIPVIADLPVGKEVHDQVFFGLSYQINTTTDTQLMTDPAYAAQSIENYLQNQSGPLTSPGSDLIAFERLPPESRSKLRADTLQFLEQFPDDWPNMEFAPSATGMPSQNATPADNFIYMGAVLLSCASTGNVTIDSNSTRDNPVVSPNWLLDPRDQDVAVQAFRRIRQWASATPGVTIETSPGPSIQTDQDILEWLKNNAALIYHGAAACKMGQANDSSAVVDSQGRVLGGIQALRVVDSSAFPFLPPGHPQSTVYMLAEKITAQIIAGKQ